MIPRAALRVATIMRYQLVVFGTILYGIAWLWSLAGNVLYAAVRHDLSTVQVSLHDGAIRVRYYRGTTPTMPGQPNCGWDPPMPDRPGVFGRVVGSFVRAEEPFTVAFPGWLILSPPLAAIALVESRRKRARLAGWHRGFPVRPGATMV